MLQISRALARQLRTVVRKMLGPVVFRSGLVPVVFVADQDGLDIRVHDQEVAIAYRHPEASASETLVFPLQLLEDVEGRPQTPVTLETTASRIEARWEDGGVPQVKDYPAPDSAGLRPFPEAPRQFRSLEPGVLRALDQAAQTTGESPRYAVHRLQLRGAAQDIVSTDGRQLLTQGTFSFPWQEDLLIPSVGGFMCREIPQDAAVSVGKTDTHVCFRVGAWSFYLAIDREGRYPEVDKVIPSLTGPVITWKLSEEDATFLAGALPRLPGREDEHAPVTVDLNGHVAIRARGEGQPRCTELVLQRSTVDRGPISFTTARYYLARALALGFREFSIINKNQPVVGQQGAQRFLWQMLGNAPLPASADALRIASPANDTAVSPSIPERRTTMASAQSNGKAPDNGAIHDNGSPTKPQGSESHPPGGPIDEAVALKESLRQAYARASHLVMALRRQRKQSRLVATS